MSVTVWEWKASYGSWNAYVPAVSNYIETSFTKWMSERRQPKVELGSASPELSDFFIDFVTNTALNRTTG
jgi:WWE domain